ncbi:ABC transporter ATP-binding protein [Dyella tabacisoli]|uniref:ABC transporter ATP-binding protein n=1 Tax=Dyella tabacisoli TaxID=2282381 RepID=UPI001CDC42EA|nr:ABC transporter ATP-binding protein [Dyella tabacisoli]
MYGASETAVHALRGIDLDIPLGGLSMLVGPSGCGKTTLISVLAGILDKTAGDCVVLGQDMGNLSAPQKTRWRRDQVGFVFQSFHLMPTLTAVENAAIPLLIQGVGRSKALAGAAAMLNRVGLGHRLSSLPGELSGGQQQRVAIARALVHSPRLVVCDEPTSALDHETGQQIMLLLREVANEGDRALVVVTHDSRIFEYADLIAQMDDGRVTEIRQGIAAAAPGPL